MPLYEYECESCGRRFELIQKVSDPPVTACVSCGGTVRKLLSSPAIQFKGTGWYVTDYARKGDHGKAEAAGKDGEPSRATAGTEASSSSKGSGA